MRTWYFICPITTVEVTRIKVSHDLILNYKNTQQKVKVTSPRQ